MKVAHVMAYPYCRAIADRGYHLCEATVADNESAYRNFYRQQARQGAHVILDNGAAEDSTMSAKDLAQLAVRVGATEIIVPDRKFDMDFTISSAEKSAPFIDPHQRILVPQGETEDEWWECFYILISKHNFPVIGVTQDFETFPGGRAGIVNQLTEETNIPGHVVHLLGLHKYKPYSEQIKSCLPYAMVRGIDTGKAAAYAQHKQTIGTSDPVSHDWSLTVDLDYLKTNMSILEGWADAYRDR